jgi:hypothetical protein
VPPKDALEKVFGPPSSSSDDSNEVEADAEADAEVDTDAAGARRVRRNPMEGVGKWSTRLGREIVEEDYLDALQAALQRLPWAKGRQDQRRRAQSDL